MKKVILALSLLVLADFVNAQTFSQAEALADANASVCTSVARPKGCTDAEVLESYCAAAVAAGKACVDDRASESRIYATYPAYRDSVILPTRNREQFQRAAERTYAAVMAVLKADPAKCLAIIAAAGKGDPSVCK